MIPAKELSDTRTQIFAENYDHLYSLIFSSIYTKVLNFHDAEDICQEVFLRFYQKIDVVENPRKWLFGTLRNVVLDYYNRKGKKDIDIENIFNDVSMSYVNGFRDTRLIIEEALEKMHESEEDRDRTLFDLISFYNFTYEEAGKHVNLTYKQVRTRYARTVKNLIACLSDMGVKSLEDLL